jgi:hypothetical protein
MLLTLLTLFLYNPCSPLCSHSKLKIAIQSCKLCRGLSGSRNGTDGRNCLTHFLAQLSCFGTCVCSRPGQQKKQKNTNNRDINGRHKKHFEITSLRVRGNLFKKSEPAPLSTNISAVGRRSRKNQRRRAASATKGTKLNKIRRRNFCSFWSIMFSGL